MHFPKTILVVVLFFTVALSLYKEETDLKGINFIEGLIRKNQPEGQIIYTDKINNAVLDKIKKALSRTTIQGISKETKQNSITLTRPEKKYILEQLEMCNRPYWNENLFSNSKLIREEELLSYIKKAYEEYSENYNNPNNTESDKTMMVKNYQRPNVFEFSCPVYFRNNSCCLIYFSSICGNPCGFEELCFYRKVNNKWEKWILVSASDF